MSGSLSAVFAGLVLALSPSLVLGQDTIGCFVPGECIGNIYIDITTQETVGKLVGKLVKNTLESLKNY